MPVTALGAPHTTSISVPVPASTLQTLRWSEFGCGSAYTTCATTNGFSAFALVLDALDLEADHGQRLRDLVGVGSGLEVVFEPVEGELHFL